MPGHISVIGISAYWCKAVGSDAAGEAMALPLFYPLNVYSTQYH